MPFPTEIPYVPSSRISEARKTFEKKLTQLDNGCLAWTDPKPMFVFEGRRFIPRRYMFELHVGCVPEGFTVNRCLADPRCVAIGHTRFWDRHRDEPLVPATLPPLPAGLDAEQLTRVAAIYQSAVRNETTGCLIWVAPVPGGGPMVASFRRTTFEPQSVLYDLFVEPLEPVLELGSLMVKTLKKCVYNARCVEPRHATWGRRVAWNGSREQAEYDQRRRNGEPLQ